MMYYLHIDLGDGTVEYYCSRDVNLLLNMVKDRQDWTIGDKPTEFPAADYLEFEIKASSDPVVSH
jgi:hypothetical protein